MSSDGKIPTIPGLTEFVRELYKDGTLYYDVEGLSDRVSRINAESIDDISNDLLNRVGKPFVVIDPRHLGYRFPTYTFIETKDRLENGSEAMLTHFQKPRDALMMGTTLGNYDLIHRRVNKDRWTSAEFSKWAKERLSYFEEFETYSIFQVARWYGKDRTEPITEASDIRPLTETEQELLDYLQENPRFLKKIDDTETLDDEDIPTPLENHSTNSIEDAVTNLREDDIILGSSITYDLNKTPWKPVLMGLSLGEEDKKDEGANDPRVDLSVDHNYVISELQSLHTDYINKFTLPFITSGSGQSWADILLELRVENVRHMDAIAQDIRAIDYVQSTQSHMMTDVRFNVPPGRADAGPG